MKLSILLFIITFSLNAKTIIINETNDKISHMPKITNDENVKYIYNDKNNKYIKNIKELNKKEFI